MSSAYEFSDDEIIWEQAKSFRLLFGKHKNARLATMIKKRTTRDYLRYLLTWNEIREVTRQNIQCAIEHHANRKKHVK